MKNFAHLTYFIFFSFYMNLLSPHYNFWGERVFNKTKMSICNSETARSLFNALTLSRAERARCLQMGLSMNIANLPMLSSVFRIAPPLTITQDELETGLAILDEAIGRLVGLAQFRRNRRETWRTSRTSCN